MLRGEQIAYARAELCGAPATFPIERVGQEHLFEVETRRRVNNKTQGRRIAYRLVGPDGNDVHHDSERMARTGTFCPRPSPCLT